MSRIVVCVLVAVFVAMPVALQAQEKAKDYVCGKEIEVGDETARAETKGIAFHFCSAEHQAEFKKSPDKFFQAASKDYSSWVDPVFVHYYAIRAQLAGDRKEGVSEHAAALAVAAGQAARLAPPIDAARRKGYQGALVALQKAAAGFPAGEKADLKACREAFKPVSEAIILYMRQVELQEKTPRTAFLFRCDMAKASWIQDDEETGNPYYGEAMLKCGTPVAWNQSETKTEPKKGKGGHEGHGGGEGGGHGCCGD